MNSLPEQRRAAPFAQYLADKLPIDFLQRLRPLIEASYEEAFSNSPREGELSYRRNHIPSERTDLVLENVHGFAEGLGMKAIERELSNHYVLLELVCNGLTIHVKHYSPHENLSAQIGRAKYRQEQTATNAGFAEQLGLFSSGQEDQLPDEAYVILFYQDSATRKDQLGDIYFVTPSTEDCSPIATAYLERVIESAVEAQIPVQVVEVEDDFIDLPSHRDDEDNQNQEIN